MIKPYHTYNFDQRFYWPIVVCTLEMHPSFVFLQKYRIPHIQILVRILFRTDLNFYIIYISIGMQIWKKAKKRIL